jgi:uncharacterized membrane protein YgcG
MGSASANERILRFISDVVVERDGDLGVTETIEVQAEGERIRHGIFRDFPTIYTPPNGKRVEVGFQLEGVTCDGVSEHSDIESIDNGIRIRIGKSDELVEPGRHVYEIRYRTRRQIGFFVNYDELYWNATGVGWIFPIDVAEARITLPAAVPFLQKAFYTGAQGEVRKNAAIIEERPGRIVFRTTSPLPDHNGLTVATAFRKGVVEPPTTALRFRQWLEENPALPIMIGGFLAILLYYAFVWFFVGRDPPPGAVVPLFGPPDGMSPAATRYVEYMGFDDQAFAAAIVGLGVKGRLRIVQDDSGARLETREGGKPLTADEKVLAEGLFCNGSTLELDQVNHAQISKARSDFGAALARAYQGGLFADNYLWSGLGLVFCLLLQFGSYAIIDDAHQFPTQGIGVATGMMGLGGWFAVIGAGRAFGGRFPLILGLVVLALSVAGAVFVLILNNPSPANLVIASTLLVAGAIAGAGFPLLKAASPDGRRTMDQIEGFREYLSVAEEDRLNAINAPKKTPELFERFLPYAIALSCQNAWARQFAGELALASADSNTGWYSGSGDWSNDPVALSNQLGTSFASTLSASAAEPGSSSGSGGGGFSGGGGGGGGGGGW